MLDAAGAPGVPAQAVPDAPNLHPPPGNPRFPLFDSLRAIAALSVFGGHVVEATRPLAAHRTAFLEAGVAANGGVAIFFVISGFLLYRPFLVASRAGRPLGWVSYARRRVLRIGPAYWLALTVLIVFGLVGGVTAGNWPVFYGFGQIYSLKTLGGGIGVAWTLCTEVTFYLALPIFAGVMRRIRGTGRSLAPEATVIAILAVASLVFRDHYSASLSAIWVLETLPANLFWFACGMGLAIASVAYGDARPTPRVVQLFSDRSTQCWAVALVLLTASYETSLLTDSHWRDLTTFVLRGLAAALIVAPGVFATAHLGLARRALALPRLSWLGMVSYGFYLYHPTVIDRVLRVQSTLGVGHSIALTLVLAGLGAAACAAASYYVVERPIMRWGRPREPALATSSATRRRPGAKCR